MAKAGGRRISLWLTCRQDSHCAHQALHLFNKQLLTTVIYRQRRLRQLYSVAIVTLNSFDNPPIASLPGTIIRPTTFAFRVQLFRILHFTASSPQFLIPILSPWLEDMYLDIGDSGAEGMVEEKR